MTLDEAEDALLELVDVNRVRPGDVMNILEDYGRSLRAKIAQQVRDDHAFEHDVVLGPVKKIRIVLPIVQTIESTPL